MTADQTTDGFDTSGWTREKHHRAACVTRARLQYHEREIMQIRAMLDDNIDEPIRRNLEAWLVQHDRTVAVLGWQGVISAILATREQ